MLLLILALGCSGKDAGETAETGETGETGDTGPLGEGTLALTFSMDPDYIDVMPEGEEPVGPFWGQFWYSDEVTSAGPEDGAEALGDIYVETVDLRPSGDPTGVLFTSDALPATEICVLGFLDSDGNADTDSPDPDDKDPVTLPGDNRFDVVADSETTVSVYFGLLNP